MTLELGSNSALIVDWDAALDTVLEVAAAFTFRGKIHISLQRIYVYEAIYPEIILYHF